MKTVLVVTGIALLAFVLFKPRLSPSAGFGLPMYGGFMSEGKFLQ